MQIKKFSITFALGAAVLFASNVAAHGRFLSPPTRIAEGDENQGFTKTRGPTTEEPCAGVPFQGVKSNFSPGQTIPISWEIGAAHKGTCSLQLSNDNAATFTTIKEFPNCADSNGIFNDEATLPSDVTCDQCVLRWRWDALLTKELYLNCADISIGGGGGGSGGGSGEQPPAGEPSGEPQPQPQPGDQPTTGEEPQPGDGSPTGGEPQPGDEPPTIEQPQPGEQPPAGEPSGEPQPKPQPGDQPPTGEPSGEPQPKPQPGDQPPTGEEPQPGDQPPTGGEPQPGDGSPTEPCTDGPQPTPTSGEPSTGGETGSEPGTGGETDGKSGSTDGQVHRRSAPRRRPRRLRRSDW